MSITVNVQEAETRLSELLARVEKGEQVVIARAGRPVANLVAFDPAAHRQFGGYAIVVPDDFSAALPAEELSRWE